MSNVTNSPQNLNYISIDNIKWWIIKSAGGARTPQPLCPIHNLRLRPIEDVYSNQYNYENKSHSLYCQDCHKSLSIPREYQIELAYVIDRIDALVFSKMKFINLDDQALPIAQDRDSSDTNYFVTALLTQSKTGLRLVVYAGEKGKKEKTQIFVEPEIKRLAFDQKDLHPTDVFTKLEATFNDGTKNTLKKSPEVKKKEVSKS